ncbi:MAG: hypothetical protein ACR2KV_07715 [Solirubrobacteraceae bacterium]
MPTRAVFRCQFCDATPDHGTQRSLQGQVSERMFGEYLDAFPGRWLVWNGGGPLGPRRYACRKHRGDLVAYLRYHYATVAAQVWKMPPYEQRWPDEKRPHMGGSMGIIKFGLRGGLLQDLPAAKPAGEPRVAAEGREPPTEAPADSPAAVPAAEQSLPPVAPDDLAAHDELVAPDDLAAHDELVVPDQLLAPDELVAPDELFPPGELFVPETFPSPVEENLDDDEGWPGEGSWPPGFPPEDWPPDPPGAP